MADEQTSASILEMDIRPENKIVAGQPVSFAGRQPDRLDLA